MLTSFLQALHLLTASTALTNGPIRLASWNLRFDSQPDNITVQQSIDALPDPLGTFPFLANSTTERPWSTRRLHVAQLLLNEGVILAGFQEALIRQVDDLLELLGDDWAYIGVGRNDGVTKGEFNPIFYKKSKITLLSNETFWLSNTPFKPSKFPGANSYRIATLGHFQLNTSPKKNFTYINTHLDQKSDDQRKVGASLLLTRARFAAIKNEGEVVFVGGDFNSPPTGRSSAAYNITTGILAPVSIDTTFAEKYAVTGKEAKGFKLVDLLSQVPRRNVVGKSFVTSTGFSDPGNSKKWGRIDFIFGGEFEGKGKGTASWSVQSYKVVSALSDDGTLASDHRPVFADIVF